MWGKNFAVDCAEISQYRRLWHHHEYIAIALMDNWEIWFYLTENCVTEFTFHVFGVLV